MRVGGGLEESIHLRKRHLEITVSEQVGHGRRLEDHPERARSSRNDDVEKSLGGSRTTRAVVVAGLAVRMPDHCLHVMEHTGQRIRADAVPCRRLGWLGDDLHDQVVPFPGFHEHAIRCALVQQEAFVREVPALDEGRRQSLDLQCVLHSVPCGCHVALILVRADQQ